MKIAQGGSMYEKGAEDYEDEIYELQDKIYDLQRKIAELIAADTSNYPRPGENEG
jgi:hypothetical protein